MRFLSALLLAAGASDTRTGSVLTHPDRALAVPDHIIAAPGLNPTSTPRFRQGTTPNKSFEDILE
jgi:hypothetical protein